MSDFNVTSFSSITPTTASVTNLVAVNGRTYDITVSGGDLSSYVGIVLLAVSFSADGDPTFSDLAGNQIGSVPTSEMYFVNGTLGQIQLQNPTNIVTNADSLVFRATFSQDLTNVDTSDFVVTGGTTATVTAVLSVDARTYDLTVSGGDLADFNGFVGLQAADPHSVTDSDGNPTSLIVSASRLYLVDNLPPSVASINRKTPSFETTNADSLVFEAVIQGNLIEGRVDASDFVVSGGTTATITDLTVDDTNDDLVATITVSGGDLVTFNGVVGIDISAATDIVDDAGNPLALNEPPIDETYTVDNIAPQVASIAYQDGSAQRSIIRSVTVNFDSDVIVDSGAFVLTTKSGTNIPLNAPVISMVNGKTQALLTFAAGASVDTSGSLIDGNYRLNVLSDKIRDRAGNAFDGDRDGAAGGDAVDSFFRLYGDSDGDRDVDGSDFLAFRRTFRKTSGQIGFNAAFDVDNDGDVDGLDFLSFRDNFRKRLDA
ncbi:MAG: dockerin type I domain-containing protein [Planctomycetota bacterium]